MGRRGPPPLPPKVIELRGTENTARKRDYTVKQLTGEVTRPAWLKGKARKQFDELVDKFMKRGQQVVGLENAIAVYAQEMTYYEEDTRRGVRWNAADKGALLRLQIQFYDTAASQVGAAGQGGPKPDNPFAKRGKPGD